MLKLNRIRKTAATEVSNVKDGGAYLVSYHTIVAVFIDGKCYETARRFSVSTSRHIREWCASIGSRPEEVPQEEIEDKAAKVSQGEPDGISFPAPLEEETGLMLAVEAQKRGWH